MSVQSGPRRLKTNDAAAVIDSADISAVIVIIVLAIIIIIIIELQLLQPP